MTSQLVKEKPPLNIHSQVRLQPYACMKSSYREYCCSCIPPSNLSTSKNDWPPKLPPELEPRIFETCALDTPQFLHGSDVGGEGGVCGVSGYTTMITKVLLTKKKLCRIYPFLIAIVIMEDSFEQRDKLGQFLVKLTNGKTN